MGSDELGYEVFFVSMSLCVVDEIGYVVVLL